MLTKFLDFDKIYNFCFNEKIVTQKNLSLQAFVIATLENSFGRSTLDVIGSLFAFWPACFHAKKGSKHFVTTLLPDIVYLHHMDLDSRDLQGPQELGTTGTGGGNIGTGDVPLPGEDSFSGTLRATGPAS